MKPITVLAIEDETPALKRLVKMIDNHPELQLLDVAKTMKEAQEKILKFKPELLFLDIQLKDASAFELLSEIKNRFSGKIIFVTAFDVYAVKAFELDALDYLLKPYSEERFNIAVDKAISRLETFDFKNIFNHFKNNLDKDSKMLLIPEGNKNHYISQKQLMYLYSDAYYTNFVLQNEKKMIRISLKKLEEILPENFRRINKSTIINKNYISEIIQNKNSGRVILADKNEFFISENFINQWSLK